MDTPEGLIPKGVYEVLRILITQQESMHWSPQRKNGVSYTVITDRKQIPEDIQTTIAFYESVHEFSLVATVVIIPQKDSTIPLYFVLDNDDYFVGVITPHGTYTGGVFDGLNELPSTIEYDGE